MGRGRQKAKHTKVARELKYFSPSTDLTALEKEIGHPSDTDDQYVDKWADLYPEDSDADEETQDEDEESDEDSRVK
ncbi:DUF3073 domain-containing protein [Rhodoluna lacicola]|jgi:hypothetical protein|uniref:DUF3073 domain-containing protein n=1 Tax=Rhodoluna lacicola TaxID=529884 RepID=A0A060JK33_9MICO|nr:DUF3073 domain-containing protein [Rhodoluna lacicola]AIC46978.1 Protein of unknown function (DUF3073) [Rhodoluna lacicola]